MKIVITGGHFSPAYTIIQKMIDNNEILVIGRKYAFEGDSNETFEYEVCKKLDIPFKSLKTGRLQRVLTRHTLPSMAKFPKGVIEARKILNEFKPDVVVTFGGYIALPVSIAAKIMRIPIVLHEQTQEAGLSSKLIAKFASIVCISFRTSAKYFPKNRTVFTGNPLRDEILDEMTNKKMINNSSIYITGGSTGAHAINEAIYSILPELIKDYTITHQTGNSGQFRDYEKLSAFKGSLSDDLKEKYCIEHFFSAKEAASLISNSSLVISRSGINTTLELMALNAVCLVIPLPTGQHNEQLQNAKLLKKIGIGDYIEQKKITPALLLTKINDMINERNKYVDGRKNIREYILPEAAEKIIAQINFYGERKANV